MNAYATTITEMPSLPTIMTYGGWILSWEHVNDNSQPKGFICLNLRDILEQYSLCRLPRELHSLGIFPVFIHHVNEELVQSAMPHWAEMDSVVFWNF